MVLVSCYYVFWSSLEVIPSISNCSVFMRCVNVSWIRVDLNLQRRLWPHLSLNYRKGPQLLLVGWPLLMWLIWCILCRSWKYHLKIIAALSHASQTWQQCVNNVKPQSSTSRVNKTMSGVFKKSFSNMIISVDWDDIDFVNFTFQNSKKDRRFSKIYSLSYQGMRKKLLEMHFQNPIEI